jgi:5-methyltetrahydropteroyltriglutamate--homocysteine methyltransferase
MNAERILTTHVGSLVRPDDLVAFLKAREDGVDIDKSAFDECVQRSVGEVVRQQSELGLDIVNDGEFGKSISWSRYVVERLSGFEQRDHKPGDTSMARATFGQDRREFAEFYQDYDPKQGLTRMTGWAVTEPISYQGHDAVQADIAKLKQAVEGVALEDVFMPAVAPASVVPDRLDEYYASDEDYVFAVADALHEEYKAIVDAGFILQIDDAYLASYYDVIVPPGTMADYHAWAEVRVEALNRALKDIPEERTRYHVCWGSWNGPHVYDVELKNIIDLVLEVRVGGYSLEMANPRHEHEWQVFKDVKLPPGRQILPGVISHSTNVVEHPELVAERITRLAKLIGRENVVACTDCGFAQGPFVRRVHPSIMWAKLDSLVSGARIASSELY